MPFGQLVIGAPGSGKTTYCNGAKQYLTSLGRETVIVNLDPGNDVLPYDCAVDVMELIKLEDVMEEFKLGPNGGLVYCMEFLETNIDWLEEKLASVCAGKYVLFDCPGQVELFTHHHAIRNIAEKLSNWGWQVCCVHLVDSHHCSDGGKFLSTALVALSAMTMLEMPHVNVLSKMDLVQNMGR
ncbi:GPN-loop GTPase [Baffinella frigidus]|nr:GPN-loop GTPase [Cryptophyta sp. CCMP2293]